MPKRELTSQAEPGEVENHPSELDPVIDALLIHLPAPGDPFPSRRLWLQIFELVLDLVYPPEEETAEQPNEPPP